MHFNIFPSLCALRFMHPELYVFIAFSLRVAFPAALHFYLIQSPNHMQDDLSSSSVRRFSLKFCWNLVETKNFLSYSLCLQVAAIPTAVIYYSSHAVSQPVHTL